jgi:hypothetical protein
MDAAIVAEFLKQGILGALVAAQFWIIVTLARKVQQLNELRVQDTEKVIVVMTTSAAAMSKQADAILSQKDSIAALTRATEDDSRALRSLEQAIRDERFGRRSTN